MYWRSFLDSALYGFFQHHFASHEDGVLKSDRAAFEHVAEAISTRPERIVFPDDNQLNVDGTKAVGLRAYRGRGPSAARAFGARGFDAGITPCRRPVAYTVNEQLPCQLPFKLRGLPGFA